MFRHPQKGHTDLPGMQGIFHMFFCVCIVWLRGHVPIVSRDEQFRLHDYYVFHLTSIWPFSLHKNEKYLELNPNQIKFHTMKIEILTSLIATPLPKSTISGVFWFDSGKILIWNIIREILFCIGINFVRDGLVRLFFLPGFYSVELRAKELTSM